MKILFTETAWNDYLYWQRNDQKITGKINDLLKDIQHQPFKGIGKLESLKYVLSGFWSRRINQEHRLVYKIDNDVLYIIQCRYHY